MDYTDVRKVISGSQVPDFTDLCLRKPIRGIGCLHPKIFGTESVKSVKSVVK